MYNPETALGTIQRTKTNKTNGVIKNVQSRDSIGHNTKNKDKQNKRGNQECTIQRQHWAQLDCTFLITPFVLFVFVLCILPNAASGLYILERQTKQKG
jgi:hypothetical protein